MQRVYAAARVYSVCILYVLCMCVCVCVCVYACSVNVYDVYIHMYAGVYVSLCTILLLIFLLSNDSQLQDNKVI